MDNNTFNNNMKKDQVILELHRRIAELGKSLNDFDLVRKSLIESNCRFKAIFQSSPLASQPLTQARQELSHRGLINFPSFGVFVLGLEMSDILSIGNERRMI